MYSAYFHQDWQLDDSSADDVVKRYMRSEPIDAVAGLRDELMDLLSRDHSEAELSADLGPFTTYVPANDGLSVEQWIDRLIELLDNPI